MDVLEKFNNLSYNKQKHKFHDSSLISITFDFEKIEIQTVIEFCRYIDETKGDLLNIEFVFKNVSDIHFKNDLNKFGVNDDVHSFIAKKDNTKNIFIVSGYYGWEVSFSASDFIVSEVIKEKLNF